MNIGIDIDDTITNTYYELLSMVAFRYGFDVNRFLSQKPTYRALNKILPDYKNVKAEIFPAMAKVVPLKENVVSVLNKLREDGHKIIFITARNLEEYKDPYKISYDYLTKHNVPFDKLIVDCKHKGNACVDNHIDLFIDDSTHNCIDVKSKGINTLQFDAPFNQEKKRFQRVSSWDEVYNIVKEMYA